MQNILVAHLNNPHMISTMGNMLVSVAWFTWPYKVIPFTSTFANHPTSHVSFLSDTCRSGKHAVSMHATSNWPNASPGNYSQQYFNKSSSPILFCQHVCTVGWKAAEVDFDTRRGFLSHRIGWILSLPSGTMDNFVDTRVGLSFILIIIYYMSLYIASKPAGMWREGQFGSLVGRQLCSRLLLHMTCNGSGCNKTNEILALIIMHSLRIL